MTININYKKYTKQHDTQTVFNFFLCGLSCHYKKGKFLIEAVILSEYSYSILRPKQQGRTDRLVDEKCKELFLNSSAKWLRAKIPQGILTLD